MSNEFYRTPESRLNTIVGGEKTVWVQQIKDAKKDYDTQHPQSEMFFPWLLENYGIQLHFDGPLITTDYTVTDEQKYLIFLLKYSGNK